jgi:hypothetical protein
MKNKTQMKSCVLLRRKAIIVEMQRNKKMKRQIEKGTY